MMRAVLGSQSELTSRGRRRSASHRAASSSPCTPAPTTSSAPPRSAPIRPMSSPSSARPMMYVSDMARAVENTVLPSASRSCRSTTTTSGENDRASCSAAEGSALPTTEKPPRRRPAAAAERLSLSRIARSTRGPGCVFGAPSSAVFSRWDARRGSVPRVT